MQLSYVKSKVCKNERISSNIYRITVEGDFKGNPGQFYMLRSWRNSPLLSRPISINMISEGGISFLFEVRGEGTELLSILESGSEIELLGPLGNGIDTEKIQGKIALIAGGMGIAPILHTARNIKNSEIDLYAGFRDEQYILDEFSNLVKNTYAATDSGIYGYNGRITDIFSPWDYNLVICCGPEPMMKAVMDKCIKTATPVLVSMESHMACGIGACLVCTCETNEGMKRICKDGPVFWGREVMNCA